MSLNDFNGLRGGVGEVCPPEDVFVQMLQGSLDEAERQELDAHLDRCPLCSQLVLELADLISHYSEVRTPPEQVTEPSADGAPTLALDGYQLEEMIGAGGMGVVYRARDLTLEREVAVKVIRADLLVQARSQGSEQPGKRLLQEARMLARVDHPNVVSIYAASFAGEHLYIVMELIEGETLDRHIRAHELDHEAILALYIQVCRGLEAAHARGVIHRDVKPSNILVNTSNDAILTDFGLARAAIEHERSREEGESGQSSLTRRGVVLGTPAFMPPEQHLGGVADERSDVFACCASIFWSIFAERPFEGSTIEEVALNACAGDVRVVPLPTLALRELHAVLIKGMARKKEARHGSISELAEELQAVRDLLAKERERPQGVISSRHLYLAVALVVGVLAVVVVVWTREPVAPTTSSETSSVASPSSEVAVSSKADDEEEVLRLPEPGRVHEVVAMAASVIDRAHGAGEAKGVVARKPPIETPPAHSAERKPREPSRVKAEVKQGEPVKEEPVSPSEDTNRRLIAAQAKVTGALERHDARACHKALDGLSQEDTIVQLLRGQCLLLDGDCDGSDALFKKAYDKISPGRDISGLLELNRKTCKPSKDEPEALLAWQSSVLFYRDVALCEEVARQIVSVLDRGTIQARLGANEMARLNLRNNLGYGLRCLARAKDPASLCDVVEKMAYYNAKLTGHDDEDVAMRVAMSTIREVPELTICVE